MPEVIKTIFAGDSSQLTAEYRKLSAELQSYIKDNQVSFKNSATGHAAEIRALKLEADGFSNLATSMRANAALKEQAIALAQRSNIPVKQALSLLQEEYRLRKDIAGAAQAQAAASTAAATRAAAIANPRATGLPGGGGLAPLTPQSLQAMDRAIASQRELRRQTLLAGQSGKNGALGFLAFSQAVEDSAYGIRGVLNNIPQMILGFGGTAGLAGAISLAAVAAVALYPRLKALTGLADSERLEKAAAAWEEVFKKGMAAARGVRNEYDAAQKTKSLAEEYNEILRDRLQLTTALSPLYDDQLAADRAARTAASDLLKARSELVDAQGGDVRPIKAQQDASELDGIRKDIENRQKELDRAQSEITRLNETKANIEAEADGKNLAILKEEERLLREIAKAEANRAQAKSRADDLLPPSFGGIEKVAAGGRVLTGLSMALDGKDLMAAARQFQAQTAAATALKNELEELKKSTSTLSDIEKEKLAKTASELTKLQERITATYQEKEALKALIKQRRELLELENQTAEITRAASAWKALQDAIKKAREEAEKGPANDPITNNTEANEADKKRITESRKAYLAEILAIKLQASGQQEKADFLRREVQLKEDALALSRELGITEARALTLLREKQQILEPKSRGALRNPGAIRNTGRGLTSFGLRSFELGSNFTGGLRNTELRRRSSERTAAGTSTADPQLKLLERSANSQDELLAVFKKLGVY